MLIEADDVENSVQLRFERHKCDISPDITKEMMNLDQNTKEVYLTAVIGSSKGEANLDLKFKTRTVSPKIVFPQSQTAEPVQPPNPCHSACLYPCNEELKETFIDLCNLFRSQDEAKRDQSHGYKPGLKSRGNETILSVQDITLEALEANTYINPSVIPMHGRGAVFMRKIVGKALTSLGQPFLQTNFRESNNTVKLVTIQPNWRASNCAGVQFMKMFRVCTTTWL